ncbi:hypothetical protein BC936DRAFT_142431, partial [Jimgerdemannia flammicorona]
MVLNSIGSNSLHHPAMATIQPNSKSSTLHLVFDALHAALTSDRSVFDECKFMSEKARRKSSVDKIFRGDHCTIGGNPAILKLLRKHDDRSIEFSGVVTHIRPDMHMAEMMLALTDKSIYFLHLASLRLIQHVPLASISSVSMSRLTDNFFALHGPQEPLNLHLHPTHRAENGDRLDSYGHAPVSERPFRESVRRPVRARLCARGRVHGLAHRCVHRRAGEGESRVNKLSSCTFRVRPFWKRSSTIERTISPTLPPNARCFLSLHTHTFSIIIATSHFFIVSSSVFFFF